jgi:two-component sensor histidine kinase
MAFSRPSRGAEQSLRAHLLKVVIAAMASMFAIAAGSIGWHAWSEHKVAEAEIARTVHTISAGLDESLLMTRAALESLAAALEEGGTPEALHAVALAVKAKRPECIELALRNADGEVIFTTAAPHGSSVVQSGPRTLWVKEAMARGGSQVSGLLYSEALKSRLTVMLLPVVAQDGTRFGLTASIPADKWAKLLPGLPNGWVASIVDRNGVIVARSRRASEYVGTKAPEWFLDATRVAPAGQIEGPGIEGERLTGAYSRSAVSGWTIVFAAPTWAMWAPLRRALVTAVAVNGLVLGVGLLMVSTFARRLSRSMDWLARAADTAMVPSSSMAAVPTPMAREFSSVYEAIQRVSAHFTADKERQLTSMRELHHRVGNEIQAITSFISMAGRASQSEESRRILSDLEGRIDVIHVAHAQLNEGGEVDTVELGAFLSEVCSRGVELFDGRAGGRIAFQAQTDRIHVRHDIAVSLGLIANEFVTNSAKHAFPLRPGTISLGLKAIAARRIIVTLSDDGVGISTENRRSSGLRLIAGLAEHVGAAAEWDVDGGTRLRLQLCGPFAPIQEPAAPSERFQDASATAAA